MLVKKEIPFHKRFCMIDSTQKFWLSLNDEDTLIERVAGAWVIDTSKLLSSEDFYQNPVFKIFIHYDDGLKEPFISHTDLDITSISGVNGQLVTVANIVPVSFNQPILTVSLENPVYEVSFGTTVYNATASAFLGSLSSTHCYGAAHIYRWETVSVSDFINRVRSVIGENKKGIVRFSDGALFNSSSDSLNSVSGNASASIRSGGLLWNGSFSVSSNEVYQVAAPFDVVFDNSSSDVNFKLKNIAYRVVRNGGSFGFSEISNASPYTVGRDARSITDVSYGDFDVTSLAGTFKIIVNEYS